MEARDIGRDEIVRREFGLASLHAFGCLVLADLSQYEVRVSGDLVV